MSHMTMSCEIRREDVPEAYAAIVDIIGLEAFLELSRLCGGQTLYLPKMDSLERGVRDKDIRARFDGKNYGWLCAHYRLSDGHIRKIVRKTKTPERECPPGNTPAAAGYAEVSYEVHREDVPEEYLDIVDEIGLEAFLELSRIRGGAGLTLPKLKALERDARDRDIRARFDGKNFRQLGALYHLSGRQIRRITNGTRT